MKTLRERTEIQQAFLDGAEIEFRHYLQNEKWVKCLNEPIFDWVSVDYRIKPKPMEIWVNLYNDGDIFAHKLESIAEIDFSRNKCKGRAAVKFIEVIE